MTKEVMKICYRELVSKQVELEQHLQKVEGYLEEELLEDTRKELDDIRKALEEIEKELF